MAQPLSEHDEDFGSLDDFAPEQAAVQPSHADFAPEEPAVQPRYGDFAPEQPAVQPRYADFAPEQPAVKPRYADFEPLALPPEDTQRDAGDAHSWFVGILVLLIVGGVWLGLRAIPPAAAPSEVTAKQIASATVERQPIERPGIVPAVPSSSQPDRAVSVDRNALPVEKPRSAPVDVPRSAPVEKPRSASVEAPRSAPVEAPRSAPVEKPRSASAAPRSAPVEKPPSASVEKPRSAPVAGSPGKVVERPSPPPSPADASQVSPPMPRPATAPAPSPPLPVPTGEEAPSALVAAPEPAPASPPATTEPRSPGGAPRSGGEDADRVAIQDLLGRYRTAFGDLDVAGVQQVWPSVNQRSLERAFRQLEGQDLFFFSCTIGVAGRRAEAACVGSSTFIPTVGNHSPQSGPSQWNFKLSKTSAGPWLIDEAQAR